MNRARWPMLVFAACAFAAIGVMVWITIQVLALEEREFATQMKARRQETVRLALWRMDSLLAPLVSREAVRPYFHYQSFYPADRAYTRMWQEVQPGEVLVPSPLLVVPDRFVKLHVQIDAQGAVTSPQAPVGNMRDMAESGYVPSDQVIVNEARLAEATRLLTGRDLPTLVARACSDLRPLDPPTPVTLVPMLQQQREEALGPWGQVGQAQQQTDQQIMSQSVNEYAIRSQAASQNRTPGPSDLSNMNLRATKDDQVRQIAAAPNPAAPQTALDPKSELDTSPFKKEAAAIPNPENSVFFVNGGVASAPFADLSATKISLQAACAPGTGPEPSSLVPLWVGDGGLKDSSGGAPELFFFRAIPMGAGDVVQGVWLDWPALSAWLRESVADLIVQASLIPVTETAANADPSRLARTLAGVRAELVVPEGPSAAPAGWTPMRSTIALGWVAAIGALVAVGLGLRSSMELAERRGRFVSAVTHELRTPLTTFCLYSQMLADNMVVDAPARAEYLGTLKSESKRLAGIVENVLEFARLSRARRASVNAHPTTDLAPALDRLVPALAERATHAGVSLDTHLAIPRNAAVRAEPAAIERILTNLVENACKYGAAGPQPRVLLDARSTDGRFLISVTDHGPGIPPGEARAVFQPFVRGRSADAAAKPGLGLGLSLARTLARQMGGDLTLAPANGRGATFTLEIPAA